MRPSVALQTYREQIRTIVLAHCASNVRVFGSVIRGEDTDDSDLSLLVEPTPETSLMDIGAIRHELKSLLGVNVYSSLLIKSHNQLARNHLLFIQSYYDYNHNHGYIWRNL